MQKSSFLCSCEAMFTLYADYTNCGSLDRLVAVDCLSVSLGSPQKTLRIIKYYSGQDD